MSKGVASKNKTGGYAKTILGLAIILFSIISILCLITGDLLFYKFGSAIKGFMLGVFGLYSFIFLIRFIMFGIKLVTGNSIIKGDFKVKLFFINLLIDSIVIILQIALSYNIDVTLGDNITNAYNLGFKGYSQTTIGGVMATLFGGLFESFMSKAGVFVLYGVILLLSAFILFKDLIKVKDKANNNQNNSNNNQSNNVSGTNEAQAPNDSNNLGVFDSSTFNSNQQFNGGNANTRNAYFGGGEFLLNGVKEQGKPHNPVNILCGNFMLKNGSTKSTITQNKESFSYSEQFVNDSKYIKTPYTQEEIKNNAYGGFNNKGNVSNDIDSNHHSSVEYDNSTISGPVYTVNQNNGNVYSSDRYTQNKESNYDLGNDRYDDNRRYRDEYEDNYGDNDYSLKDDEPLNERSSRTDNDYVGEYTERGYDSERGNFSQTAYKDEYSESEDQESQEDDTQIEKDNLSISSVYNPLNKSAEVQQTHKDSTQTNYQQTNCDEEPDEEDKTLSIEDMPLNYKYNPPPLHLLGDEKGDNEAMLKERSRLRGLAELVVTNFKLRGITISFCDMVVGVRVASFVYSVPPSVLINKIVSQQVDIAMWLQVDSKQLRIIAPVPGTSNIAIEIPHKCKANVTLKSMLESNEAKSLRDDGLYFALGKDMLGKPVFQNLTSMPHMLVAGATGTGKSVFLNALLTSILYLYSPEDVRLIIVDPKVIEFSEYQNIPHLLFNEIITDPEPALEILEWAVQEMNTRYKLFQGARVKKISEYNKVIDRKTQHKLPYIVILIDEFADFMMSNPVLKKKVDYAIGRLAQKARAAGISLLFATQRPSTDSMDGSIKANFTARVCFKTADNTNSLVVLGESGAEKLLGNGDMFYKTTGTMERAQGAYISNEEVQAITAYVSEHNQGYYDKGCLSRIHKVNSENYTDGEQMSMIDRGNDMNTISEDFKRALRIVIAKKITSKSGLQTKMGIGYNKAARIIEWMEKERFISPALDNKSRDVYITIEQYEERFGKWIDPDDEVDANYGY